MSEVVDFRATVMETNHDWADEPRRIGRLMGVIDGQRWAALCSAEIAEDEPAAKAYLLNLVANTPKDAA